LQALDPLVRFADRPRGIRRGHSPERWEVRPAAI
jgi:hypothetical protein